MTAFDPSLYLVTDPGLVSPSDLVSVVQAAVRGGVSLVQLRDKAADGRRLVESARALRAVLAPMEVPLIVNDRVDVAMVVAAEGVHVGQSDITAIDARRIMGPSAIVGLSIEHPSQATSSAAAAASYLAVSPVYGTPTKTDTVEPLGLEGVAAVRKCGDGPVVGIGGIDGDRAPAVIRAGADGVAVVSAILGQPDVRRAAARLRAAVDRAKSEQTS